MSGSPSVGRDGHRPARLRGTLPSRAAYALMASVIGLALFTSGTPSPLYETYRALWGFSPVVLTLVYATYAFGVLASLLLAGSISDRAGRRPVLICAIAGLMLTTVIFMAANSLAWLFIARTIQGLATGLALGAASAASRFPSTQRSPRRRAD
jgi:MFS family permease